MTREIHAILRGGPGDGRFYVVPDLREIRIQSLTEPVGRWWEEAVDQFPVVPYETTSYLPTRILAEFTPGGVLL